MALGDAVRLRQNGRISCRDLTFCRGKLGNTWSQLHVEVSKNRGVSPQIIHFNRVFHYFHHPFWGPTPIFGSTPMWISMDKTAFTCDLLRLGWKVR